jgi:hypothetical protein
LSYGEEKVTVKIDTVGYMSAKDRIFKKNFPLNASQPGVFMGFLMKEGDYVVKGSNAYRLKGSDGRTDVFRFTESGTVSNLSKIESGTEIRRGQNLANLWEYHLNPNVDIKNLSQVPGTNKQFAIYVGTIKRGGLDVSVIEVKDPAPINPERKASNEAKNRQPLGFGSKDDVTTSGNWE